ncbi:sigma-70 family RNA polymerase sigma factor [Myroides albus]|uniref:Sigma-70 family RNA polymerase sigma factor n=1 Tax=Myroides albus TaxID=2562892 RepID=A0A6I3LTE8_9FLAO|nr:sigma-70 family RNA polymerase sigma factor [Myroides albus]MTG99245.1 sigma-70 family RNA polymerase sigma factor [Myroides albus]UVD79158.1 sigma-70 family RNA polymerase sigma factor [Myroides albus]
MDRNKWVQTNYDLYWDILYRYAYNLTREHDIASDIVQDVFIAIWSKYDELTIDKPKAYLLSSVKYKSLHYIKNRPLNTLQLETVFHVLSENDLLSEQEQEVFQSQLLDLIYSKAQEVLPLRCFEVFYLRFYQHYSYKEIASRLSISESTVENHISKSLKILRVNLPTSISLPILCMILSFH